MASREVPGFSNSAGNKFLNDGSFMEMFKKQMKKKSDVNEPTGSKSEKLDQGSQKVSSVDDSKPDPQTESQSTDSATGKRPVLPFVGKRRGASRALKTGIVAKKPKPDQTEKSSKANDSGSAWAKYLEEVNQYKSKMCMDEDKSRPLVK